MFALKYTHTELSYVVKYRSNISVCTNINIYLYLRKRKRSLFEVTGSHMWYTSVTISETVQDRDTVTTDS